MEKEFIYLGYLSKEAVDFFGDKRISEQRDGCATVGTFIIHIKDIELVNLTYKIYFDTLIEKLVITDCGSPIMFLSKDILINHIFINKMMYSEWADVTRDEIKKEIDDIEKICIRDNRLNNLLK